MPLRQGDIVRTDLGLFRVVSVAGDGYSGIPVVKEGSGYRETSTRPAMLRTSDLVEVVYPRYSRIKWNP
jgi:hypothetical protein